MAESIRPYGHYKRQVIINDQYLQREHFVNTYIYIYFKIFKHYYKKLGKISIKIRKNLDWAPARTDLGTKAPEE